MARLANDVQPTANRQMINSMMKHGILAALLLSAAAPAIAQPPAGTPQADTAIAQPSGVPETDPGPETPPTRMSTLVVYGDDPCPRSSADEIVVCAREPESERYRLPRRFRESPPDDAATESWTNRAATLESVSRVGTPNSCSPVGSGGATGCYQMFLRMAREENEQRRREAAGVP